MNDFERGYKMALADAAAECRRIAMALDHNGQEYVRYSDALMCANTIERIPAPTAASSAPAEKITLPPLPKPIKIDQSIFEGEQTM